MSLNRLFWLISVALMLIFLALTARIVSSEWGEYRRGTRSVEAVQVVQLTMIAMEKTSIERGPSNALMGGEPADLPQLSKKLQVAREQTDASIATLLDVLRADADVRYAPVIRKIESVKAALEPARLNVDRQVGVPRSQRSSDDVSAAVSGMIDLIPPFVTAVADLTSIAIQSDPQLLDGLTGMRVASSLREYAGQVGSKFTAPVITQRPLTKNEVIEIGKLYGRIEQLRSLLNIQMRAYRDNVAYNAALSDLDAQYFGKGLPFLGELLQIGLVSGSYELTTAELAARYVPPMSSILRLRDVIQADLVRDAEIRNRQARNYLVATVVMALVAFAFFFVLMYLVRQRVLAPVLRATTLVTGLAVDNLEVEIPTARYRDEIGDMLRALQVLKARSFERIGLAGERETLIQQLQVSSNTDFLTGVMNRRAFFAHSQQQLAVAQRYKRNLALILLDVDHFKRINDNYGHLAGDSILRSAVQLIAQLLRKVDILARYGGEEFIILLPEADMEQALVVAEKLRSTLSQQTFAIDDVAQISITASFGVSALAGAATLDYMIRLADEALYKAKNGGRNQVVRAS
ncbi:diguanylate cyclase (GGDEF) domain-containing protein [Herbaspirillum sp. CF444]|uniref:GGDEF domain-containing protein n=1 Tax=Herbaspirillum sp. CF444 TaxID=1144319 RepID=UPI0002726907|nr:GGDEF domain-containing protein [Herbaspirillum sp. CF444]EJL86187.1 diguanylate cyclase (GGDEF) domain-containing protein [Herbaspirillum sp. CF444]